MGVIQISFSSFKIKISLFNCVLKKLSIYAKYVGNFLMNSQTKTEQ